MTGIGVDWEQRVQWQALRSWRRDRMRSSLETAGIDGLLVQRVENLKYLTSVRPFVSMIYTPRYAAFTTAAGATCLLTEAGDRELNQAGMPWIEDLRIWPYDPDECVAEIARLIQEHGLQASTIGYDDAVSPYIIVRLGEQFAQARFVDATRAIGEAKAVKGPDEIAVIRKAIEVAEVGMAAAIDAAKPGVRECEVAGEAVRAMFASGADALLSHPQVSADPLRRIASDQRLRYGDLVLIDLHIGYNGYGADFARTVSLGGPSAEQKRTYKVQLDCLHTAAKLATPGATTQSIQDGVREIVERAELGRFWHSYITGHGVGTGSGPYEQPMIGAGADGTRELVPGMVIALEPGIFRPGVGPVRVEEMVLVTEDASEILTRMTYDSQLLE